MSDIEYLNSFTYTEFGKLEDNYLETPLPTYRDVMPVAIDFFLAQIKKPGL